MLSGEQEAILCLVRHLDEEGEKSATRPHCHAPHHEAEGDALRRCQSHDLRLNEPMLGEQIIQPVHRQDLSLAGIAPQLVTNPDHRRQEDSMVDDRLVQVDGAVLTMSEEERSRRIKRWQIEVEERELRTFCDEAFKRQVVRVHCNLLALQTDFNNTLF